VGDPACALDEELTIDINLTATRTIGEVAKGVGVRKFFFASTCSVYGASDELVDERSELNPVSLYARTKIASEKVLLDLADASFQPIIGRFATIHGISGRTRFDLVVNLLTAKALMDGEITVHGGDQWRPFVHVDDAARAIALLLAHPSPHADDGPIFNIGSNAENYTISQIAELVRQCVPTACVVTGSLDGELRNYRVKFDKIARVLEFRAAHSVDQGIKEVAALIQAGKIQDYRQAAYSNATFLREFGRSQLERPQPRWARELIEVMAGSNR
jgi:nucleoside-diphosphate-sugar epimerase